MNKEKKSNQKLKKRLIKTFVIGTMLANIIITAVGVVMSRLAVRKMRMKYGEGFEPSMNIIGLQMLICTIFILVILGVVLYSKVYRDLMEPIRELSLATKRISEGDLDFTVEGSGREDEIDDLCGDFEEMRKRLKTSVEENLQKEEGSRQLISNITHDLKTPMTTIKGYAEGLLDGVADTQEKQQKYLQTIYKKTVDMDRLINELTYYTHIDQSRIPYNFDKININPYFEDFVSELKLELEGSGFVVTYSNNLLPDTMVIADRLQLKKVINNIIENSIKYADKPEKRIDISLEDRDEFILIKFRDNGKGIDIKDLPVIFDRFFRSDAARSSATGGSGIGLSIVKKIIEDHGGRIWATSVLGEYTQMHIELRKHRED